jgi:hypothetical protein
MRFLILVIFISFLLLVSCKKPESYSTTPAISFTEIPIKDTVDGLGNSVKRCVLTFHLIDGDGDIGFQDGDTLYPYQNGGEYYNNLIIKMYKFVNGNYFFVDTPELGTPFYFRTKYLEPIGQNKILKCNIFVNLDFNIPATWDSVRFDFFMYDRALHKSNTVSTPLVVL